VTLERLTDRSVAEIVKKRVVVAGFDPLLFSGHSLRAGFVTSAASWRDCARPTGVADQYLLLEGGGVISKSPECQGLRYESITSAMLDSICVARRSASPQQGGLGV
jgi:hypothetical protein